MTQIQSTILIADAGSTKVDWRLLVVGPDDKGKLRLAYKISAETRGINAVHSPESVVVSSIGSAAEQLSASLSEECGVSSDFAAEIISNISVIFFYGAGCRGEEAISRIEIHLNRVFGSERIEVNSDLMCAAKALLGRNPGIIAILGTGSNSALYDGERFVENTPSLGFILGDEGSGSYIGKRLLSDILKGLTPEGVARKIMNRTDLNVDKVISEVYRSDSPASYLASFTRMLPQFLDNARTTEEEKEGSKYVTSLLVSSFEEFIKRNLSRYQSDGGNKPSFSAVGSVAAVFRDQLEQSASNCGFSVDRILTNPIDEVCTFHLNEYLNESQTL